LANNGNITYKHVDSSGKVLNMCDVNNSSSDCRYVDEYDDLQNNHYILPEPPVTDPKNLPHVGNTTFYYENSNPTNHVNSIMEPSNFLLIVLCIITVILLVALVNLYLIRTYPGYGAVLGGVEAASDVASIFSRKR
jgi:hypothetical protein